VGSKEGLPVVGVRYRMGGWGGKPALREIEPLYDRATPPPWPGTFVILAREGYALGAVQVDADDLVRAVRLAFMRIRGDKLDKSDLYVTDWIGTPASGAPVVLDPKGRPIVGFRGRMAAVVDALGIVVGKP
jgi:hypothetical protein